MSLDLMLDLTVPLAPFTLSVEWITSESSLGIFGHSGAGKTTILEAIAGHAKNAEGMIRVNGRTWLDSTRHVRLSPEARGVGYVPQDGLLFPHLDVMGNVLAGRRRAERSGSRKLPIERVLAVLELTALSGRSLATLSGGERQRVALGRALCSGPELLLLDEPLAGLDLPLRRRILPYLLRVREEFAIPTVYVSHDAGELTMLCREVLVLSKGKVMAVGSPAQAFTVPSVFPIARAEGFENVLAGKVVALEEGAAVVALSPTLTITVPGEGLARGSEVMIGLRAEDLILATERLHGLSAQNVLSGVVTEVKSPDGSEGPVLLVATLDKAPISLVVTITRQAVRQLSLRPGVAVDLVCKAQACRVLSSQ